MPFFLKFYFQILNKFLFFDDPPIMFILDGPKFLLEAFVHDFVLLFEDYDFILLVSDYGLEV